MKNNVLQTLSILFLAVCFMSVVSCDKNDDNYSDYDTSDGDVTYVAKDVFKLNGKTYYYLCDGLGTSYSFATNSNGEPYDDECFFKVSARDVPFTYGADDAKYGVFFYISFKSFDPLTAKSGTALTAAPNDHTLMHLGSGLSIAEEYTSAEYARTLSRVKYYDLDLPLNGKIQFVSYKNNYITLSFNNVTFTVDDYSYSYGVVDDNVYYDSESRNHSFTDNTVTINGLIRFKKQISN